MSNTLEPANQLSSDAFAGTLTNQTNLALKGIIGIKAMAEIAKLVGNSSASSTYDVSLVHLRAWAFADGVAAVDRVVVHTKVAVDGDHVGRETSDASGMVVV